MKRKKLSRLLSFVLAASMAGSLCTVSASASPEQSDGGDSVVSLDFEEITDDSMSSQLLEEAEADEDELREEEYAEDDIVRVSIVLEEESTVEAGYSIESIAEDSGAIEYRETLYETQEDVIEEIEDAIDQELDVVWNLTLAANLVSANVEYSLIDTIADVDGVDEVVIENCYEPAVVEDEETSDPAMATSSSQIGSATAWEEGYTGAGSRIAVIDTGIDTDHQSFDGKALEYSLSLNAEEAGMTYDEYVASLDLLDAEEIAEKLDQLNASESYASTLTADDVYYTTKIAFGYNYIDESLDITHDNDSQGEHGSHVEGIAAANAYIPDTDSESGYTNALDAVSVQGVAPDAQILSLKVFGSAGGAYDSDIFAAIEDAVVLGADSINLSLGGSTAGFSTSSTQTYQSIMESLEDAGAVVCIAGGNAYSWTYYSSVQDLYADDVTFDTVSYPASYTNSLAVASVANAGSTGDRIQLADGSYISYTEYTTGFTNENLTTLAGEQEYVYINGFGTEEQFEALADVIEGKIAVVTRGGGIEFSARANYAAENGAAGLIVVNNASGTITMDLSSYNYTIPVVSVTQSAGEQLLANTTSAGTLNSVGYYTGTLTISANAVVLSGDSYTMSTFSSWGVPGSLELKPEITAPGGSIYSVDGSVAGGTSYETMSGTSMATPQVSGMTAVVAQYIRDNNLEEETGLSSRQLAQSLLMSTAVPLYESDYAYYSVLKQGAGLGNVGNAVTAKSYILMGEDATDSASDGKVKAELGDDPDRDGYYEFTFTLNNFSDENLSYDLSGDLFTQDTYEEDGVAYLSEETTAPLAAEVSFAVDGIVLDQESAAVCDLDEDGDTDANDAQVILNYLTGLTDTIDEYAADVDEDGVVTTYDAYLILCGLASSTVLVEAGESVEITVMISFPDTLKESLDATYTDGAYIEGYIYAEPVATAEGEITDSTHSIPVLGFYGNWSDPSMYEPTSYAEYLYDESAAVNYSGVASANALVYQPSGDTGTYYQVGNPCIVDTDAGMQLDRWAVSGTTTISYYQYNPIRNVGSVVGYILDGDGDFIYVGSVQNNISAGYWYSYYGYRMYSGTRSYTYGITPYSLGLANGDELTVGLLAVPEYYEGEMTSDMTETELETLISDTLAGESAIGSGASLSTTMTVDSTKPTVTSITYDQDSGEISVTARDNQYIAAIMVANGAGTSIRGSVIPDQTEPGQTVKETFSNITVGNYFVVYVYDYAGNETVYRVAAKEAGDYTGRIYTYSNSGQYHSNYGSYYSKQLELDVSDPDTLDYVVKGSRLDFNVDAAEYYNGYIYLFADDGYQYVSALGTFSYSKLGYYADTLSEVRDMAYSYSDGKMYVLDGSSTGTCENKIYSMDLTTGALTYEFSVSVTNPSYDSDNSKYAIYFDLMSMTVDDEGNFYSVGYAGDNSSSAANVNSYLYSWSLSDISDENTVDSLNPVNNTATGYTGYNSNYKGGSLAWDHDDDTLYWVCSAHTVWTFSRCYILTIDTETGSATKLCGGATIGGYNTGLIIIPDDDVDYSGETTEATSMRLTLDGDLVSETKILKGAEITLEVEVYPYNLADKSVTWTSSDESVVTVEDGTVTGISGGEATITVTTNASPNLTASCVVTVKDTGSVVLSGLYYDTDETYSWREFSSGGLTQLEVIQNEVPSYVGATLLDGLIYARVGTELYSVDPDTFETVDCGSFDSAYSWTDAAGAPTIESDAWTAGEGYGILLIPYQTSYGQYMAQLNPESGTIATHSMSELSDSIVAITYAYETTYTSSSKEYPAEMFYFLTDSGDIYSYLLKTTNGSTFTRTAELVSSTGLSVDNGSMIYDEDTEMLFLATENSTGGTTLYAIDPEYGTYSAVGKADGVLSGLYQFERTTELTVQMLSKDAEIYEEETVQLSARVLPSAYQNAVTWSSDDESIATVDENGLVTGVSGGTAVITATSVDADADGNHASASVTVTVIAKGRLTASAYAQVTDADGNTGWSKIDLSALTAESVEMSESTVELQSAGYFSGDSLIYGVGPVESSEGTTGNTHFYRLNPANGYAAEQGAATTYTITSSGALLPGGFGSAPAVTYTATDADGNDVQVSAFGYPVYIYNTYYFRMLTDFAEGTVISSGITAKYACNYGPVYIGLTYTDDGVPVENFISLRTNSASLSSAYNVLLTQITPSYDAETGEVSYSFSQLRGFLDRTFINSTYSSLNLSYYNDGTQEGVLIAATLAAGEGVEFYITDLTLDDVDGMQDNDKTATFTTSYLGTMNGVTSITGLYTGAEPSEGVAEAVTDALTVHEGTDEESSSRIPMDTTIEERMAEDAEVSQGQFVNGDGTVIESAASSTSGQDAAGSGTSKQNAADDAESEGSSVKDTSASAANAVTGSLQSLSASSTIDIEEEGEEDTVTLTLTEDEAVTNGRITVTYDPDKLTFGGIASATQYAVNVDEEKGEIVIAYAIVNAVEAGDAIAALTFSSDAEYLHTEAQINTAERNQSFGQSGEETAALNCHNYVQTGEQEVSCTKDGYIEYTCSVCGDTYQEIVAEATGHSYVETVVEPTCTARGYTIHECSECGNIYYTDLKSAAGHSYEITNETAATCTSAGTVTYTCAVCKDICTEETDSATGHTYAEDTSKHVDPTCTEEGSATYVCSSCGDSYTETIAAAGHDYVETVIEPTCTESGRTEHKCSECGNIYYTDLISATGHVYAEDTEKRVEPTCTEDGSVTYVCGACGDSFTDTLAATGHSWDAGVVTKVATATDEGEITYTCTLCGETYTEVIEAIATVGDTVVLRSGNTFSFWYTLESDGPDLVLNYGREGDEVLIGDWDGDGIDTVCVRRGNTFYFKNDFSSGDADYVITYGREGDEVLVGDWDGDGKDTLAVRRNGNEYHFKYTIDSGDADEIITYGRAADEVLVGDWDGDGKDTLAVRRNGNIYYFKNTIESGASDDRISYGRETDEILVGDWDGDEKDTLCARRGNKYYFKNTIDSGDADLMYTYGDSTDESYVGRWR